MKRIYCLLVLISLVMLTAYPAFASTRDIQISIDGEYLDFDVKPFVENGRTLVPFRAIFEKLGASVEWLPATEEVVATKDGLEIRLKLNSTTAYVNGVPTPLDVAPRAVQGRTFVPLRFVSEKFGLNVDWNATNNEVVIVAPKKAEEPTEPVTPPVTPIAPPTPTPPTEPVTGEHADLKKALAAAELYKGQMRMTMETQVDVNGTVVEGMKVEYSGKVYHHNAHIEGKVTRYNADTELSQRIELIIYDGVQYVKEGGVWRVMAEVPTVPGTLGASDLWEQATIVNKGPSVVNGETCTLYEAQLPLTFAKDLLGEDLAIHKFDLFSVDFYVDSAGRLVRQAVMAVVENEWEFGGKVTLKVILVVDYFDHGQEYVITPPKV